MNSDTIQFCDEVKDLVNDGRCRALVAVYRDPGRSMAWYEQKADLAHNYMSRFVSDYGCFFVVEELGDRKAVSLSEQGRRVGELLMGLTGFESGDFA